MTGRASQRLRARLRRTERKPGGKSELDWQIWRDRVRQAMAAMQPAAQLTDAQAAKLLAERTQLLAAAQSAAQPSLAEVCEVASFALGSERYAIETRFIMQTLHQIEITPVPGAPELLVGVIIFQGELVPLFDARRLFSVSAAPVESSWAVILGEQEPELGLLVDETLSISRLPIESIVRPPPRSGRESEQLHRGMTADGLIVLHGEQLLRDPRLS